MSACTGRAGAGVPSRALPLGLTGTATDGTMAAASRPGLRKWLQKSVLGAMSTSTRDGTWAGPRERSVGGQVCRTAGLPWLETTFWVCLCPTGQMAQGRPSVAQAIAMPVPEGSAQSSLGGQNDTEGTLRPVRAAA